MIKILHTGDLHLDSPLSSLEFSVAEAAREEHRRVFEKMMRFAIDEALDMILISGDLGVALVYAAIILFMLFAAGMSLFYDLGILGLGVVLFPFLWDHLEEY